MFAGKTEIVVGVDTMMQIAEEYLNARIKNFKDEQCVTYVSWQGDRGFVISIDERADEEE